MDRKSWCRPLQTLKCSPIRTCLGVCICKLFSNRATVYCEWHWWLQLGRGPFCETFALGSETLCGAGVLKGSGTSQSQKEKNSTQSPKDYVINTTSAPDKCHIIATKSINLNFSLPLGFLYFSFEILIPGLYFLIFFFSTFSTVFTLHLHVYLFFDILQKHKTKQKTRTRFGSIDIHI